MWSHIRTHDVQPVGLLRVCECSRVSLNKSCVSCFTCLLALCVSSVKNVSRVCRSQSAQWAGYPLQFETLLQQAVSTGELRTCPVSEIYYVYRCLCFHVNSKHEFLNATCLAHVIAEQLWPASGNQAYAN